MALVVVFDVEMLLERNRKPGVRPVHTISPTDPLAYGPPLVTLHTLNDDGEMESYHTDNKMMEEDSDGPSN